MTLHLLQLPRLIAERRSSAIFGVLIIAMLWAGILAKYGEDVRSDLADAERTNQSFAMVFEENVLRSLGEIDKTLLYLRRNVEAKKDTTDYNTIIHGTDIFSEIIVQVAIIDAKGIMRASSVGPQPSPPVDLSDREHFRAHLGSNEDRLFISKPMVGRVSGKWSVQVSRRFSNADGTFGGVVVASLDPEHFTKFYDKVDLAFSGSIVLLGSDGVVRAAGGQPGHFDLGQDIRGTKLFDYVQTGINTSFEERASSTGETRLVSLRRVRGEPLWVSVSVDKNEALADSRASFHVNSAAALILSLLILAAMERIFRTEARAQQKSQQLELTLENMSQGIMLVTEDLKIPIINKRCGDLLKLPPEFIINPPRFDQLIEYRNSSLRSISGAVMQPSTPFDSASAWPQSPISEWTMSDGTVLEVRKGRLPDGGLVQTFTDITKRVQAEAHIARLASEDSLTGLLNRRGFHSALVEVRNRNAAPVPPEQVDYAVLFLDLDRFKVINDTLSHRIGDLLLQSVAKRLLASVRSTDVLARLGGDEFAVILKNVKSRPAIEDIANCLIKAISGPCEIDGYRVHTSVSMGIAIGPQDSDDPDALLAAADAALYAAKERNRGGFRFYQSAMTQELSDRRQIEMDLSEAIEAGKLELHYQPIVGLRNNVVTGFEALARWRHRSKGFVAPSKFIPVAEDTGMIMRLGEWALNESCRQIARLPDDLTVAVNLSPVQFSSPNLVDVIRRALLESGMAPHRLELEITERLLLDNSERVLSILRQIKQLGVRIALDDFGTGYSALSYLRQFPLDRIKIDRSFVSNLAIGNEQAVIVQAVLSIARALGMTVTVEGVETSDQREFLRALGCENAQGYLFGDPVPFEKLSQILAAWKAKGILAA